MPSPTRHEKSRCQRPLLETSIQSQRRFVLPVFEAKRSAEFLQSPPSSAEGGPENSRSRWASRTTPASACVLVLLVDRKQLQPGSPCCFSLLGFFLVALRTSPIHAALGTCPIHSMRCLDRPTSSRQLRKMRPQNSGLFAVTAVRNMVFAEVRAVTHGHNFSY